MAFVANKRILKSCHGPIGSQCNCFLVYEDTLVYFGGPYCFIMFCLLPCYDFGGWRSCALHYSVLDRISLWITSENSCWGTGLRTCFILNREYFELTTEVLCLSYVESLSTFGNWHIGLYLGLLVYILYLGLLVLLPPRQSLLFFFGSIWDHPIFKLIVSFVLPLCLPLFYLC